MKYAHLENNRILGWYDKEINPVIPTPNIEATEEQWQEAISINANYYENGKFIVKDLMTDEEKETLRINSINSKTEQIITTPYPIYKQLNIDNLLNPYTIEMRENKNMFIETVRNIGRKAKDDGTQPEDINWAGLDEVLEPYQVTQDLILKAKNLLGE